jgi:hypothetical protein
MPVVIPDAAKRRSGIQIDKNCIPGSRLAARAPK